MCCLEGLTSNTGYLTRPLPEIFIFQETLSRWKNLEQTPFMGLGVIFLITDQKNYLRIIDNLSYYRKLFHESQTLRLTLDGFRWKY